MALVMFAGWKPWDIKRMPHRERKFWVAWYRAIEERRIMSEVTRAA